MFYFSGLMVLSSVELLNDDGKCTCLNIFKYEREEEEEQQRGRRKRMRHREFIHFFYFIFFPHNNQFPPMVLFLVFFHPQLIEVSLWVMSINGDSNFEIHSMATGLDEIVN